jgi:hypothetical protein
LAKGRALARPSERSERFEPGVRPDGPDTVAAATQKEKADAADAAGVLSKLFAVVQNIHPTPFDDANDGTYLRATRCGDELPMLRTFLAAWHFQCEHFKKAPTCLTFG